MIYGLKAVVRALLVHNVVDMKLYEWIYAVVLTVCREPQTSGPRSSLKLHYEFIDSNACAWLADGRIRLQSSQKACENRENEFAQGKVREFLYLEKSGNFLAKERDLLLH